MVEEEVSDLPANKILKRSIHQAESLNELFPHRAAAWHRFCEVHLLGLSKFHAEVAREHRPQLRPAELVTVGDIESLAVSIVLVTSPSGSAGEKLSIGGLVKHVIGAAGARKTHRQAKCLVDSSVNTNHDEDIHGIARGISGHALGAQRGPREATFTRDLLQQILGGVVEVRRNQARISLFSWDVKET